MPLIKTEFADGNSMSGAAARTGIKNNKKEIKNSG